MINPPPQLREPPPPIDAAIDASGQVIWNNSPLPMAALQAMMEAEVQRDPTNQPELRIDANADAQYDIMAKVLAAAKNAQMQKIGFVQQITAGTPQQTYFHAAQRAACLFGDQLSGARLQEQAPNRQPILATARPRA